MHATYFFWKNSQSAGTAAGATSNRSRVAIRRRPASKPFLTLALFAVLNSTGGLAQITQMQEAGTLQNYAALPLAFTENMGQTDSPVRFTSRTNGVQHFFTADGFTSLLSRETEASVNKRKQAALNSGVETAQAMPFLQPLPEVEYYAVKFEFLNSRINPQVVGEDPLPWNNNYFKGNSPAAWRTGVPNYEKIRVSNLYDGIDLLYYGSENQVEYDLIVAPFTDPQQIVIACQGADFLEINSQGELEIRTPFGTMTHGRPTVYQMVDGRRQEITAGYAVLSESQFRAKNPASSERRAFTFEIGEYDPSKPLHIDPVLRYRQFLRGSGNERGFGITVNSSGSAYITGFTDSNDFPQMAGPQYSEGVRGDLDIFVVKLNPGGNALEFVTFIGGSRQDFARGIALGPFDRIYVAGATDSEDFPTQNVATFDPTWNGSLPEDFDAFVLFLNPTGDQLFYSSYLGGFPGIRFMGDGGTFAHAITVDTSGAFYVTGVTNSAGFPTTSDAFDTQYPGSIERFGTLISPWDAFVTKFTPSGTALEYSTYIGGIEDDFPTSIAVDNNGAAYICGETNRGAISVGDTTGYPMTNAWSFLLRGNNVFVSKINPSGTALEYSFLLAGRNQRNLGTDIAIDETGAVYIAGYTGFPAGVPADPVPEFPTTAGAFDTTFQDSYVAPHHWDAFVFKLNPAGNTVVYSTLLGGSMEDFAYGVDVDGDGNAYVSGWTNSNDFPLAGNSLTGTRFSRQVDLFVTRINPTGTGIDFSNYLGDVFDDMQDIGSPVVFQDQALYVTWFSEASGGDEAFVAKIDFSDLAAPMSYVSSTTTQSTFLPILRNTVDRKIIGIQVETAGGQSPLEVTEFSLSTNGTTNPGTDIRNAKIYSTGSNPSFNTNRQFGVTVPNPAGAFTITGSQQLTQGTNFFWLTYDIPATATPNNLVDAECQAIVIAGVSQTPTVTAPPGAGTIVSTSPGLAGIGTIGPGGDFATFTSALEALAANGVSGAVTFNVMPGFYYEQILITNFGGSSQASSSPQSASRQQNAVIFQSATGNPQDVILAFAADTSLANYVIFIANTEDSIVIKNMTIQAFGEQYGRVIYIDYAENLSLLNNVLESVVEPNRFLRPSSHALIHAPSFATIEKAVILGNSFKNGSAGIFLEPLVGNNIKIIKNRFENQSRYGINVGPPFGEIEKLWINENSVTSSSENSLFSAISIAKCNNLQEIRKNKIALNEGGGIGLSHCRGPSPTGALIANNFVQGGMGLAFSDFLNIYHNSVHVSQTSGIFPPDALLLNLSDTTSNVNIVNNIFSNSVGGKAYAFITEAVPPILSDYNDLYTTGLILVSVGGTGGGRDLAEWQAFSGLDANSVSVEPGFVSASDLHTAAAGINNKGTPLPSVPDDIDGEPRDPANPDIGADEDVAITEPVSATGVNIPFVTSSGDTIGTLNFSSLGTVMNVTMRVYANSLPPNLPPGGKAVQRYYDLGTDGSGFNARLTLCYKDEEVASAGLSDREENLELYRYDGSQWLLQGGTVDTAANCVTLANVTQFSLWTLSDPEVITSVFVGENAGVPKEYRLAHNYPNPFNPSTSIEFELPSRHGQDMVELIVYNLLGQKVKTLLHEAMLSGVYKVVWDGRNDRGEWVASGIYIYGIRTDKFTAFKKMTVIK